MECHESDPYSWDYEQITQFDIAEAIHNVIVKTTRYMDEYSELVRRAGEEQCTMLHQITETAVEAQDHFKGLTLQAPCETFQDEDLEESFEDDPNDTTS